MKNIKNTVGNTKPVESKIPKKLRNFQGFSMGTYSKIRIPLMFLWHPGNQVNCPSTDIKNSQECFNPLLPGVPSLCPPENIRGA